MMAVPVRRVVALPERRPLLGAVRTVLHAWLWTLKSGATLSVWPHPDCSEAERLALAAALDWLGLPGVLAEPRDGGHSEIDAAYLAAKGRLVELEPMPLAARGSAISLPALMGDMPEVGELQQEGLAPRAVMAYLASLGWPVGAHAERLGPEDLAARFDPDALWKRTAPFDMQRLREFSRHVWQETPADVVAEVLRPLLVETYGAWQESDGTAHTPEGWLQVLVQGQQGEAHSLREMVSLSAFAFQARPAMLTTEAHQALTDERAPDVLRRFVAGLSADHVATPAAAQAWLRELRHGYRDREGLRGRRVMFPLRAALTGTMQGPCLGVVVSLLGQDRCRARAEEMLTCLASI